MNGNPDDQRRLALELVDEMRSEGLSPDHVTYGSAVSAMAKAGQWVRALSLLREMMEEGLAPNLLCYGAAIDACANGRQWQMAVELLDRMRQSGLEPDRYVRSLACWRRYFPNRMKFFFFRR